jgi:hypothetical protein
MKNKQLRFAFFFAVMLSASISFAQMNYWTTPPYKFNMNPSTPTRTNIPPGFTSYEVANGAYDQAGNLLFYVVDGNLISASGNSFGNLGGYNLVNCDEAYDYLQAEVAIVPVPGTCRQFYVIYAMDNPIGNCKLLYVKVDCSGSTPAVAYSQMVSVYCPPDEPYYAGEGFVIGNGGHDHTSFAVSGIVSGEGAGAQRYLYSTSSDGIYKYTITSTAIASGILTAPRAMLSLDDNSFEGLEAELSWNRDIFAWIDPFGGKVHTIRLKPDGDFLSGSLVSYNLGGAKGIEFTNAISNPFLYVSYPFGIRKINTATQTSTLLKAQSGVNLSKSFLEYGKNGKIYGVSPTYDTHGNLVGTTLVGIASNDTYSSVNAGFDSRFQDYLYLNTFIFTLPDQIDGDNYNYFYGNPYITINNFTLNGSIPLPSCSAPSNLYNCVPITFNATYNGGSIPSQYKFEIRATDANCDIITGQNYINFNSGWIIGHPIPNLDLRDFKDDNELSLGNITGKVNIKYSMRDACGNESSINNTILVSSMPDAEIELEIQSKDNPLVYLPPAHSANSAINVSCITLAYRILNSAGLISYYKILVEKTNSQGAVQGKVIEQIINLDNGVGSLTNINLNSYCAMQSAWPSPPPFGSCSISSPQNYDGYFSYFGYMSGLYSLNNYYKLTVAVGNLCGETSDYSYLYVSDAYKNPFDNINEDEYGSMLPRINDATVYPNPLSDYLTIMVNLANEDKITIELSDMSGRLARTLLRDEALPAGNYVNSFDISGLTPGMYIYRVISGSFSKSGKITKN